jgi:preprotein translocase subunit SecF
MNQYTNRWEGIRRAPYFPFLVLFIISGLICLASLRHNNTTMIGLRDQVYAADKSNGNVEAALDKLRAYVYGHMNTDLSSGSGIKPPIQLSYTYARLQQNEAQNSSLYIDAKNYCEAKIPASQSVSGRGRIECITQYVTDHGAKPVNVPQGLYQFDFISPAWSPDLAGWSLVATVIFFAGLVISFLRYKLKPGTSFI